MTIRGLFTLETQKCFDTRKESSETQGEAEGNIFKYLELNRPQLGPLFVVFRTWFSTAWSIAF